jgi:hypothetical protein
MTPAIDLLLKTRIAKPEECGCASSRPRQASSSRSHGVNDTGRSRISDTGKHRVSER